MCMVLVVVDAVVEAVVDAVVGSGVVVVDVVTVLGASLLLGVSGGVVDGG